MPEVSIIIPIFNEADNIELLFTELAAELALLNKKYELIFVDDGSSDGSSLLLDQIASDNDNTRVLHMRRNYGQTAAIMAGISASKGDILVPMDGDLQNDPADIGMLIDKLREGYDVVSGWRKDREDNPLSRKIPSVIANKIISKIFKISLHDYGCTLKAYRRSVLENIRLYGEMHRFIPIYAAWEGGRVTEMVVSHRPRKHGVSKYGIDRTIRVFLDIFLLYFMDRALDRPIQFFGKFGLYSLVIAGLFLVTAIALKLLEIRDLVATPLLLIGLTFALSGVIFLLMGVLAELQARTYYESQNKNPYSIRKDEEKE